MLALPVPRAQAGSTSIEDFTSPAGARKYH
jgi:hypothetical protein